MQPTHKTHETRGATTSDTGLSRRAMLGIAGGLGAILATPGLAGAATAAAGRGTAANTSFSALGGVPVYYGLETSPRTWYCNPTFLPALEAWMSTLQSWSASAGIGSVTSIGSAGFLVDKPGQHGAGTAMDLSIVRWSSGAQSSMYHGDHAHSDIAVRRRYFGVEATLRRHFRYLLDGYYNAAHENHFHADFGGMPERRILIASRADTVFMQAVCNNFIGSGLVIDGEWGPLTQGQVDILKSRLGITGNLQTDQAAVEVMVTALAAHGFSNQPI